MGQSCGTRARAQRHAHGGARLNFLVVLATLIALSYVGYQLVPVYYRGTLLESFMQDTANTAGAFNKPPAWVEQQLRANADYYGLPADTVIETTTQEGRVQIHVKFFHAIPLFVLNHQYKFDHTVKSTTLASGG